MNATTSDGTHGRRITDFVESLHGTGPHRCAAVEQAAVRMYKDALVRRIEEKGGPLDAEDLEAVAERFNEASRGFELLASRSYTACTEASRELAHDGERVDPFGRLIIETFSHLLTNKGKHKDGVIDRAHLPNLFKAFQTMLGEDTIWARRRACQSTVNELRFRHGDGFTWRLYYDDSRSKEILARTALDFVTHFEDFDHRVHWFLDIMNSRPLSAGRAARSTDFREADLFLLANSMISAAGNHLEVAIDRLDDGTTVPYRQILARFAAGKPA